MSTVLEQTHVRVLPRAHFLLTRTFEITTANGRPLGRIDGSSTELRLVDLSGSVAVFGRPWVLFLTEISITLVSGRPAGSVRQTTPFGRIRFELRDPTPAQVGLLEPDGYGAAAFVMLEHGSRVGVIGRRMRWFWKTGDYEIALERPTDHSMLFALAGVLAIDKAVHRRRGDGGFVPVGAS